MIYNTKITKNFDRDEVLSLLEKKRSENPNLRVVDVGGAHCCWGREYVTHIVDIHPPQHDSHPPKPKEGTKYYTGQMCNIPVWLEVEKEVEENGKFDFLLSTHTIEDVSSISFLRQMFSMVAKEGYIAVPSKYTELNRFSDQSFRGYIHHRWIFDAKGNNITAYPKQCFLEYMPYIENWTKNNPRTEENAELQFYWKDDLNIEIVNDDMLGPSPQAVMDYYKQLVY
jgi:hypothetical protein